MTAPIYVQVCLDLGLQPLVDDETCSWYLRKRTLEDAGIVTLSQNLIDALIRSMAYLHVTTDSAQLSAKRRKRSWTRSAVTRILRPWVG